MGPELRPFATVRAWLPRWTSILPAGPEGAHRVARSPEAEALVVAASLVLPAARTVPERSVLVTAPEGAAAALMTAEVASAGRGPAADHLAMD